MNNTNNPEEHYEMHVPLQQFLEERVRRTEAVVQTRMDAMDTAVRLLAKETERRLEHLNGEQGRMKEERGMFLQREAHDVFYREFIAWKLEVNGFIKEYSGGDRQTKDLGSLGFSILAAAASIIGVILMFLHWKGA